MGHEIFLSYCNLKDLDGTVSEFRTALEIALNQRLLKSVNIFQDKRDIRLGDNWKENLSSVLNEATLLIILLSPAWLGHTWCREEYKLFKSLKNSDNKRRNILPILWTDTTTKDVETEEEAKAILTELKDIQYTDWRDLQYDRDYEKSAELRKSIGKLAEEIKSKL